MTFAECDAIQDRLEEEYWKSHAQRRVLRRRRIGCVFILAMVVGVGWLLTGCAVTAGSRMRTEADGEQHTEHVLAVDPTVLHEKIKHILTPTPPKPKTGANP